MSEMSRAARRAMRAKIHRITQSTSGKVDASDYGPEEVLNAGVKTGMRPISRRAFKKGGKVLAVEGKDAKQNAGKKPRSGGKALTIDGLVNRNVKDANEAREGIKHVGGFKKGGRTKKAAGGAPDAGVPTQRFGFSPVQKSKAAQMVGLKTGGRAKKEDGGALEREFDETFAKKNAPVLKAPPPYKTRPAPSTATSGEPDMGREPTDADIAKMNQRPTGNFKYANHAKGGKVWEGSKKDEAQDKKLAKKHGMSMKKWEASSLDKKHDKQHSTKGLKRGGFTSLDGEMQTQEKVSGRIAKRDGGSLAGLELASGGRAKKSGKTNINIVISAGKDGQPAPQGLGGAGPAGIPIPVPPPGGGAPMPMPPMPSPQAAAGALGGGSPIPLARKAGGRTYRSYKDMDAGAGSGEGRLEKTEIQKHKK